MCGTHRHISRTSKNQVGILGGHAEYQHSGGIKIRGRQATILNFLAFKRAHDISPSFLQTQCSLPLTLVPLLGLLTFSLVFKFSV